jgi:hypothetical protein
MKRIVHTIAIIGIVLSALTSCRAISSFLNDDEAVAGVGNAKLYRKELNALIPKGVSYEDSVRLARQYINTWALEEVFLNIAEEQLSKAEKDVTQELETYRRSLLKFRYEQLYVNERLDTSVTEDEVQEYYETHKERFVLQRPVVKARFISISEDSPMLKPIRKKMSSDKAEDIMEADSLAFSSAYKFATWNDAWIDAATLAREFGQESVTVLSSIKVGWVERTDTSGVSSIAYISEMVPKGGFSPIEYSTPFIKDMIISARKQYLITSLERDLLEDARVNGQFVIIE